MNAQETRQIFSQNLNQLIEENGGNISSFARDVGINRTQLNRYRDGTAWPRPDILQKICEATNTDARILLTPLAKLRREDPSCSG